MHNDRGAPISIKAISITVSILAVILLLVSCSSHAQPTSTAVNPGRETSSPTNLPDSTANPTQVSTPDSTQVQASSTAQVQPSATQGTPQTEEAYQVPAQYELDAEFDYTNHSLAISETISYTNFTTTTLTDLTLVVEANRWVGSFSLGSLTWQNGETIPTYTLKEAQLNIPLAQPLQPGERLGLKVVYQLDLPEIPAPTGVTRPVPYGYSDRQTNIVDWYPYIPPYKAGTGWVTHPKWWFGEHQIYDVGDFRVRLTLVEPVQGLVIAASAPAEQVGETYAYQLKAARSFALSASTHYIVQTTTAGDVTINSYFFAYDQKAGQQVLHDSAAALELYSRLFTPYPHASLSVVEADFLDGMEYDGLFFLSRGFFNLYDGTPQGYLTFIAAHETAHQWWYGLVGNDQAIEPWLDEALCTYMEHIFYENVYADYQPSSSESIVDWWWYYRVNFYEPTGWVDGTIYDFNLFRPYRDAVYLNGAKFLQDLRTLVGDEAFFSFLKDYAVRNDHRIATAADFFAILSDHTSKNPEILLSTYFHYSK